MPLISLVCLLCDHFSLRFQENLFLYHICVRWRCYTCWKCTFNSIYTYAYYIGVTQCESFGFCQIQSYSFAHLLLLLFSHARFTSCSHHVRRGLLHIRYIHFHFVFLNKFALLHFCAANLSSLSRLWIFRVYICDVGKYLWLISNNLVNALVCRDMLSHHHSCLKHMENVCTDFRM